MIDLLIQFFNNVLMFFNDIAEFINQLWDWLQNYFYDLFTEWFAAFVTWSTVGMIKFKIMMITFAWDVAQQILQQLNISAVLDSAWSQLDSSILNALTFFNVPEAINIILSARVTRFVLNFIGL